MLFFKDKNTGKECLSLVEDGSRQNYECVFSACPNPVCTCMTLDIDLTLMTGQNRGDMPNLCHSVKIDLDKRKLETSSPEKMPPGEKAFGELLLSQLGDDDFKFLKTRHFAYKNKITKAADINEIEGYFDYDEVEMNGLMYAYNGILPYGDRILVNIKGKKYIIIDQFCLLPKCKCTDTILDLVPAGEDAMKADPCPCGSGKKYKKCCLNSTTPAGFSDNRSDISGFQFPDNFTQDIIHYPKSQN